ncbi:TetR/AcrR family transcriptional regulator [Prauserella cavernicola]|uniref:TetR/AcrR family transcriptional regulator n=1 Tax=Prauserella cavernicola TaxID=2800127 RepID=A0A934V687_9PSEU|nr:TetR/AcrR family transcriptional regulator [Prauserella cavernicola]MBK1786459.1 TetR/AcrR family transcriptional regulator [Prauserella cavernicola]
MPPRNDDTRRTQAERRTQSRHALLKSAAAGFAQHGYAGLSLESVATGAGYTRGALYHQFASKEELALAVVHWIDENWQLEVGQAALVEPDPVSALLIMARETISYCRHEAARALLTLRNEFRTGDHAIGAAIGQMRDQLMERCIGLVEKGRADGTIPPGPPSDSTALAYLTVVDAVAIQLAGKTGHDVELGERAVRGVLGIGNVG